MCFCSIMLASSACTLSICDNKSPDMLSYAIANTSYRFHVPPSAERRVCLQQHPEQSSHSVYVPVALLLFLVAAARPFAGARLFLPFCSCSTAGDSGRMSASSFLGWCSAGSMRGLGLYSSNSCWRSWRWS